MTVPSYRLAVDFGTSTTTAMLQWPDGRVRPLLFDGSPLLSSAVLLGADRQLHTGRDAAHLARSSPERLEPNPKRRIDERAVLLGDTEVAVGDLIATVLRRVAVEAHQVAGPVGDVTLTHPEGWGAARRVRLAQAAAQAGLTGSPGVGGPAGAHLAGEPVAAATYFAHMKGAALPVGACVLVYDLGAGTCDVTLLRRQPHGFELIASDGLNDVGGLDVDAAVVGFLQATYGELWRDAATRRQLWDEVRSAKEMLSRANATLVAVPTLDKEVPLGREQLEGLTRPVLRPTVAMTQALLRETGFEPSAIAGLFLVGGSSRIPLVATLLHEALGIAPVVTEQPELVVAEGALYVAGMPAMGPVSAPPTSPAGPPPGRPPRPPGPPGRPPGPPGPPGPLPTAVPAPVPPRPPGGPTPLGGPTSPTAPSTSSSLPPAALIAAVAGVLAVVVLLGAGTAVFFWLNQRRADQSRDGRAARSTTTPRASGATALGGTPTASEAPPKYSIAQIPDNLCEKTDIGALTAIFEAQSLPPSARRNVSSYLGTAGCILSREHKGRDGLAVSIATVSFSVYVFTSSSAAEKAHQQGRDEAKLNTPTITDVPGIGEQAFLYRTKGNPAAPQTDASYELEVRDANLRLLVSLTATRMDDSAWSDADRTKLENAVTTATKATLGKITA